MNPILVFTKFLKDKFLVELISIGQACGVDGYDLCVRPGYLVSPENAAETLAAVTRTLAGVGLFVPMVTASLDLVWPDQPYVRPLLEAMDRADIRLLRLFRFLGSIYGMNHV